MLDKFIDFVDDSIKEETEIAERYLDIPKYPIKTEVAKTIDNIPAILYEESFQEELAGNYLPRHIEPPLFEHSQMGLRYHGNLVTNFYYEIERVAVLVRGNSCEDYNGYSIKVNVHVFRKEKKETYSLSKVRKEELESVEFLKRVPFANGTPNVTLSDLKKILYSYVAYLLQEFNGELQYITRSPGWKSFRGKMIYVDAEKAIGNPEVPIRSSNGACIRNTPQITNLWEEFLSMRTVLRGKGQMDALLLYVLMSYSYSLFSQSNKTLKHSMFIVGARGSKKTAVALCFSQLGNKSSPKFNFLASESGIQSHFHNYQDACLLVDDLAPSINVAKKNLSEQKLETLLRLFGDAGERVINEYFLPAGAKEIDYSVCGGLILTGEYFFSAGVESSIARTVVLEFDENNVDLKKLSYYQKKPQVLETLIFRYIEFIAANWDEAKKTVCSVAEQWRSKYIGKFANDRYADYMGQYMAQVHLLSMFFSKEAGLNVTQKEHFGRAIEDNIYHLLSVNNRRMLTRAPVNTLLMSILYMYESGRYVLWGEPLPKETAYLIEKEEAFYVRQKDLVDILKLYCAKTGEPFIKMTSQELGKLLSQSENCTVYKEGDIVRLAKKHSKEYGNLRLMELPKKKIAERLGEFQTH